MGPRLSNRLHMPTWGPDKLRPPHRYRSLASVYHPDKHTDPELKERAVHSFTRIQAAYEVRVVPVRCCARAAGWQRACPAGAGG